MNYGVAAVILAEVVVFLFCIYGFQHEGLFIYLEYKMGLRKLKHNEDLIILKNNERWKTK